MSEIGKQVRLSQIFNPESGNAIMVAMDHAAVIGPVKGIQNPFETVKLLCKGKPDTFFMPIGAIKQVHPLFVEHRIPFIVSIDTCTWLGPEPDYFMLSDTVEHALSAGASAVSMHVLLGPQKTSDMLKGLSRVAIECDRLGMPLLAIMYPAGFENDFDVQHVRWAARIAAELGADLVKTYYTGTKETFTDVVQSCPVPVLLSGGEKTKKPEDFLQTLKNCIDAGGRGCAVGRNLWQSEKPLGMLEAIKAIVHKNRSVEEALAAMG